MAAAELSPFDKQDLLIVAFFAVFCGFLKELAAYVFIYRRPDFRRKFSEVCTKYEDYYRTLVVFEPRTSQNNTLIAVTKSLLQAVKELRGLQTIYSVITGVLFMIMMLFVMSYFEGCVVAKLPFTPVWPITVFTQGDTRGTDATNCAATCIYTMLSMMVKDAVQILLGYRSPVTAFTEMNLKSTSEEEISK